MQEEVENRTVNLAISTTKLTFRTIVNGYNAWKRHHQAKVAQKTAQLPVGKQSIKELIGQNQGVSSIPIEKTDLKGFEQVARKYGVDYAISPVVYFCKIAAQFSAGQQIGIESRTMLLDVPQMLSAPHSDGLGVHFFQHQTRDEIVALEFVPKAVILVKDVFFHDVCPPYAYLILR